MTVQLPEKSQTRMKAARFYAPGDVRFEEVPIPQAGPGEVVIRVEAALTCGTDLKAYRRGHPVLLKNPPSPFGHEGAGTVVDVGADVTDFQPGDRVVAANSAPCMACFFCHKQQYNLCEHLDLLNGTYAEYLNIPAPIVRHNTLVIPDAVPFEAAAFAEPLSVCIRGIEACRIQPGDTVAVIGLGTIGQFMIHLAKQHGATVIGFGRSPFKRALAESFAHADAVLEMAPSDDLQELIAQLTPEGHGFDVVIEAVGQPRMWEYAIRLVRRGGLVNLFGGCEAGTTISVDTRRMHYDELTLISLFHHTPAHFRKALEMIASGTLDPTPLITDTMPMHQVTAALEKVAAGQAMKIALLPSSPGRG